MTRRIILVDIGRSLTLDGVLPSVLLYDDYAATLKARAGQPPYAYTIVAGALPTGLYLDRATGQITGTTSAAGSFAFIVRATDLGGAYVDRPFVITVTAEPLTLAGNAPNGTIGTAYAYSYTAAGGVPPRIYSIGAGALPDGVALNTSTGALAGMPTAGGNFTWTVRVEDSLGAMFDLADAAAVAYATLTLSGAFAAATVGVAYSSDLTIAGGDGSYSNPHVTVGALPGWATLSVVSGKLRLSGTPTGSPTTVSITVAVDSGDGQTATSAQSFAVGASKTDTFAVNSLSSYTQIADSFGSWTIGGNLCYSGGNQSILARTGISFADGKVQTVLTQAPDAGIALRVIDKNNYYLAAICDASSTSSITNLVILYKRVGGTFTVLGTSPITFVRGTPHTLALEATGTSLKLSFDGAVLVSATDSSITAAGLCGMRSGNPVSGVQIFNSFTWP